MALQKLKPYIAMIFLQFGFAGMSIISVASLKSGMNHFVLVVYRNLVATVVMGPFAFFLERKVRPKMTLSCLVKILALALLEPVLDQNLYYMGAKLTNASFSQALYNLLPAMTFVLALLLRMEKLRMKSLYSHAKITGTLVTTIGAMVMILYRGPVMELVWGRRRSHEKYSIGGQLAGPDFIRGTIMLIFACFSWSLFFILQSHTLRSYPAELSLTTWICMMGAMGSSLVTLAVERGSKAPWVIGFDMRLVTAVYSGIMCSGVAYYIQGMVIKQRGPVFVTAFNPLCMIIVAFMGSFILAEEITLGRAIGAGVIVIGVYLLIWGKSKDDYASDDERKISLDQLPVSANNPVLDNVKVEEVVVVPAVIPISKSSLVGK